MSCNNEIDTAGIWKAGITIKTWEHIVQLWSASRKAERIKKKIKLVYGYKEA